MQELGLGAFRFSIAWPRVLPDGRGRVNQAGLDFYDRLVDALLEAGIRPFPTLYHWDLPQALEDAGGWPVRETARCIRRLRGRPWRRGSAIACMDWTTHNEPFCSSWLGLRTRTARTGQVERPQTRSPPHTTCCSRTAGRWTCCGASALGRRSASCSTPGRPIPRATDDADRDAARIADGIRNRWFFDPVLRGRYPADMLEHFGSSRRRCETVILLRYRAPLDFVGDQQLLADAHSRRPRRAARRWRCALRRDAHRHGVGDLPRRPRGGAHSSPRGIRGAVAVRDRERRRVCRRPHSRRADSRHRALRLPRCVHRFGGRSVARGVPVRGYFVWSLLDNFEWALGYSKRFGLVYVDYPTLERIPKDSFYWYRDLISRSVATSNQSGSGSRIRCVG